MRVILFQPQIPQNTGNIVRTCSVTGCELTLVAPLGFAVNNRWLKRAGLDYWEGVSVTTVDDLEQLLATAPANVYLFSSKAKVAYTTPQYTVNDWLVFGSETQGLPKHVLESWSEHCVTLPMKPQARCLNLATSVGIAVYEALRQQHFTWT